jgi:ethanolamine ammonia-lyase small subunit
LRSQPAGYRHAIQAPQRNRQDRYVRPKLQRQVQRRLAIGRLGANLPTRLVLNHHPDASSDDLMVVSDQYAQHGSLPRQARPP